MAAGEMHRITDGEAKGAGELREPLDVEKGIKGIDSSGGKRWSVVWETGIWEGYPENMEHTQSLYWRGISHGLFSLRLPHDNYSPQAANAPIGNLHSDGAGETWQFWVKLRYQMQHQSGMRMEGSEGVLVSK
ncbi:hypothetical protein BTVI_135233 [Pitangus sulphuratus]|nr:hypothetical protein BTVI_135233 [Pitangus sulphuratus]